MSRIIISDPENGKAYQVEAEDSQFQRLIGKTVGDKIDGGKIGLQGYELKITGGSDEEGFPMRPDVKGDGRTRSLFSGGVGYRQKEKGMRRRKTVRGNRVSRMIAQLNTKITEKGSQSIEELLGLEPVEDIEGSEEDEDSETE